MEKKLVILIGASGSGKSSWTATQPDPVVCSADDGMMEDGEYRFASYKLCAAHEACSDRAYWSMYHKAPLVVIDNTNTTLRSVSDYLTMGEKLGYSIEVVVTRERDPEVLAARNLHGVPVEEIRSQVAKIEQMLQSWPGSWPRYSFVG